MNGTNGMTDQSDAIDEIAWNAALLSLTEMGLGSMLHALHLPLKKIYILFGKKCFKFPRGSVTIGDFLISIRP